MQTICCCLQIQIQTVADSNRGDQLASCASPASRASDCPTGRNIDLRFQVTFNHFPRLSTAFQDFNHFPELSKAAQKRHVQFAGLQLPEPRDALQVSGQLEGGRRAKLPRTHGHRAAPAWGGDQTSLSMRGESFLIFSSFVREYLLVSFNMYRRRYPFFECPRRVACWRLSMNDEQGSWRPTAPISNNHRCCSIFKIINKPHRDPKTSINQQCGSDLKLNIFRPLTSISGWLGPDPWLSDAPQMIHKLLFFYFFLSILLS